MNRNIQKTIWPLDISDLIICSLKRYPGRWGDVFERERKQTKNEVWERERKDGEHTYHGGYLLILVKWSHEMSISSWVFRQKQEGLSGFRNLGNISYTNLRNFGGGIKLPKVFVDSSKKYLEWDTGYVEWYLKSHRYFAEISKLKEHSKRNRKSPKEKNKVSMERVILQTAKKHMHRKRRFQQILMFPRIQQDSWTVSMSWNVSEYKFNVRSRPGKWHREICRGVSSENQDCKHAQEFWL